MSKFNINDVIIGNDKNTYPITNRNTLCKVVAINADDSIRVKILTGDYKDSCYTVSEKYFNKIEDSFSKSICKSIEIYCIDNKTIEARYDNRVRDTHAVGIAKCHPEDEFDYLTGVKIAMERLYKEIEKIETKKFNGRIVCVESPYHWLTVGRIYDVKDGVFYADDGSVYPKPCSKDGLYYVDAEDIKHAGCINDSKHNPKNTFIPIVEII